MDPEKTEQLIADYQQAVKDLEAAMEAYLRFGRQASETEDPGHNERNA